MNKRRPVGSMEALFMQDAATAFASLALLDQHAVASDVSCGVSRHRIPAMATQLSGMRTHSLLTKLR